ncbi:unnamed protein product, partial [Rotaria magnacalcarata]
MLSPNRVCHAADFLIFLHFSAVATGHIAGPVKHASRLAKDRCIADCSQSCKFHIAKYRCIAARTTPTHHPTRHPTGPLTRHPTSNSTRHQT